MREAVAEAVHRTVCAETDSDGFGHCILYAIVGAFVARSVFGGEYWPQAGSMRLQRDPADPDLWFTFGAGGDWVYGDEFHAWFARAPKGAASYAPASYAPVAELADLSSRHFPRRVEGPAINVRVRTVNGAMALAAVTFAKARYSWKRPEPCPPFVWVDGNRQLGWVKYFPLQPACEVLFEKHRQNKGLYTRLVKNACQIYQRLIGEKG
jgi:hypothetical protein